jgi:hypothetical protein
VVVSGMEQTLQRLVIRSLHVSKQVRGMVSPSIERKQPKKKKTRPALSLNICPSYSRLNLATNSSVLKAIYARECTFSLFSLNEDHHQQRYGKTRQIYCVWNSLLLNFSGIKLLPKDSIIGHPRLYGLPEYLFGKVRGQPAHDRLEAV